VPIKSPIVTIIFQDTLGFGMKNRRGKTSKERMPEKTMGEMPSIPIFMTEKFAPQTRATVNARPKCLMCMYKFL